MRLFSLFEESVQLLKKDSLIWVPFFGFYLVMDLMLSFFSIEKGVESLHFGFFYTQNVLMYVVMAGLFYLCQQYRLKTGSIRQAFVLFKERLGRLFVCSALVNVPLVSFVYMMGTYYQPGAESVTPDGSALLGLVGLFLVVLISLVPYSAFLPFSMLHMVTFDSGIITAIVGQFKWCFLHFRLCFKWFLGMILVSSLQLFLAPMLASEFPFRLVLWSLGHGVVSTFVAVFSYVFFKAFVEKSLVSVDVVESSLSST